jgi:hypothetical protein
MASQSRGEFPSGRIENDFLCSSENLRKFCENGAKKTGKANIRTPNTAFPDVDKCAAFSVASFGAKDA